MLVKEAMSKEIFFCVPSDIAQTAARTMRLRGVGALPVVSDSVTKRLEGIVTDRDLCCSVVAEAMLAETTRVADVMSRNPVACAPENTLEDCEKLMEKWHIRRLPVVDTLGRCVGMIAQADIVLHAPAAKVAKMLAEISRPMATVSEVRAARA
jgi:CBS domain-containing protein